MNDGPKVSPAPKVVPIGDNLGSVSSSVSEKLSSRETLKGVWLGRPGALCAEVCEIVADAEPNLQTIRAAWHKRRGRRAVPLIVFWQGADYVLLTEPVGEPVAIAQVAPSAALSVIQHFLAAAHGQAAQTALALLERAQGSGGVAGFRNRNLLSTHYLTVGFRRDHQAQWIELNNQAGEARSKSGAQLMRALGYLPGNQTSVFEVVENNRCRVHALVLPEGTSFDRAPTGPGDAPGTRVLIQARTRGADCAVLVSGRMLRLYQANGGHGLSDLATASTYVELDLDILDAEWSALLPLMFSAASHTDGGLFERLISESSRYAMGLRERFKERVYENVVGDLVTALYDARGRKHVDANLLYNATLRMLYRLLFVLYAEDRNLLPLGNPEYRRVSLTDMLFRMEEIRRTDKPFDERQTTYWDGLFLIFHGIRIGNKEWNLPAYNGGLFEPNLADHEEAAFLQSIKVPNAVLAPILLALAYDEQDGHRGKVDFGDLGVRHLGTLYEGLLSYSVHIAEVDLIVDDDGMYVPAKEKDEPVVYAGKPYLTSPKGGRKTSGSYYTPSFVVRRLIDNALRPALESHLAAVAQKPVTEQWDAMLDFRVVDPAMGSGHFLVDALDAIADRLARFLQDNPRISAEPIKRARTQITAIGKTYGVEGLGESVGDFELLRRNVMRNCIYGVDLNPMAVELAKVGLWLHAFVPGLPLSYLGHNLQHGNALVGIVGHEIAAQLGNQLFGNAVTKSLNEALEYSRKLAASSDLSPEEVHHSEELQNHLEEATAALRAAFNAYACRAFAVNDKMPEKKDRARGRVLLEQADGLQQVLLGKLKGEEKRQIATAQDVAQRLQAFHWQLAFPEVFLGGRGGFDVVLGNPPWEEITVERLGFFARHIPGIKSIAQPSEQERVIRAYERHHPDIAQAYLNEVEEKEEFRGIIRTNYELSRSGDPDLYRAFAELALNISRDGGAIGMVYPRTLLAADGTAPYRQRLFSQASVTADFGLNSGGWIFPDAHAQYTIVALAARKDSGRTLDAAGPAINQKQWSALPDLRTHWQYAELEKASSGLEVPLIPDAKAAALFHKLVANGQPFAAPVGGVRFRPWRTFDATNDRKNGGILKERAKGAKGWPVYAGRNFDLWEPEIGQTELVLDPKVGIETLQRKRARSEVWADVPKAVRDDPSTLPQCSVHALFRDVTNRTNSRTMVCALVPPNRFSVNQAPVLVQIGGTPLDLALRVGVLSSLPFDWAARRRVEMHVNFFILNALPVPAIDMRDPRAKRVAELTAALSCRDERFAAFAQACGVPIASVAAAEREESLAEIDALVASMYGLAERDLETIFADFTLDAVPQSRRTAVQMHFRRLTQ